MNTSRRPKLLPGLLLGQLLVFSLCGARIGGVLADDLGRLFTSATERARIDAVRSGEQPLTEVADTVIAPVTDRVVINGTLRGSDGKRLVWLNGTPVKPGSRRDMTLLHDGRVQLTWQDGAKILKPGQGVDQASGKIFDNVTPAPVASAAAEVTKPQAETVAPAATTAPPATAGASAKTVASEPAPAVESKAK